MINCKSFFVVCITIASCVYSCSVVSHERTNSKRTYSGERRNVEYNYLFLEANRQKLIGDYQNALALFLKCVEIDPVRDAAWYEIANIYFALEMIEAAEENAKKALSLDPDNKWYYYQLARILMSQEKIEETIELYKQVVNRYPDDLGNKLTLAGMLFESGKDLEALDLLQIIEKNQVFDQVSLLKHRIYIERSEFEKAFSELNKLIEGNPGEMKYRGMLAELYSNLGMNKQALTEYLYIFEEEPDNYQAHLSIGEFYRRNAMFHEAMYHFSIVFKNELVGPEDKVSVIYNLLGDSIVLNEYLVQTTQLVELLVSRHPAHVQTRMVAADFFISNGLLERAVHELDFLSKQYPENELIWEQLIIILSRLERYPEIIEVKNEATKQVGSKAMFSYFSAYALSNLNDHSSAIDELIEGIEIVGENEFLKTSMMIMLADSYHQEQEYDKSDQLFNSVLQTEPGNLIALNNYAYYLGLRGKDLDLAESMSKQTIEEEPHNSTFLDTYAWVVFKRGNNEKALKYIELAIRYLEYDNAEVFEHYGDILNENNEIQRAREYWQKALELEPTRVHLKEKLAD